jgi:MFS family permease
VVYFLIVVALYGISFWLPQLVHELTRASYAATGALSAIPYAAAAIGMVLVGNSSDRSNERRLHLAGCAVVGMAGFAGAAMFADAMLPSLISLSLAAFGTNAALTVFWPIPSAMLSGRAAAAGIAMINSIGNLVGYASPVILGWCKDSTGRMYAGLWVLSGALGIAALLSLRLSAVPGPIFRQSLRSRPWRPSQDRPHRP